MVFFSTYKLYKQGTSQVVAWLGKSAAKCGYELGSSDTSVPEKKVEKKGSKSNRNSSSKSPSQATKHIVSVNQLPVLAKVISERSQQVSDFKTLPSIVEVLKDVITKRKQWAKGFAVPDAHTMNSNSRHKHFVTVLEDVCQILGDVLSALQLDKGQTSVVAATDEKSTSMDEMAVSNLFAVLAMEESTDQDEATDEEETTPTSTGSPAPSKPPTITYELEDQVEDEEVYFMIHCFFKDFVEVRNFIDQSWVDYKSGTLDLAAVAVTTNVALEMLQRAEKALLESLPKEHNFTNYEQVGKLLYVVGALGRGVDPNFRHKKDDVINMDLQSIADFTCLPVYIILSKFLPVLEACPNFPVYKPGSFGKIDLTGQPLSWRDRFNQDKIVLFEFLPEFCSLKEVKAKMPVVDELSRGLMDMMRTKRIPLWLVLGCQIYLDIYDIMLIGLGYNAHKQLQTFGLHVSKTVQDYLDFSKGMSVETWPQENDKFLRIIKLEADLWVNQDYFAAFQKKLFKSVNLPESSVRSYSLLSRHPLLCGLILFRLNLRLQDAGIALVTAWGSLPSVLHLYNAVKQESSEDGFPLWEDAENVIQIQGKERVFVGDYPKNAEEYLKQFSLVMGYSASSFGKNRRDGGPRASKHGPRETIVTSTMANVFRGQTCENETRSDVTFHKIEQALTKSSPEKRSGTGINGKPCPFTSVSFLSSLQAHIQSEVLALNMNYFALHMRCYNLLRDIKVQLDPKFRKYMGPEYVEKENQLPFLVGYLFLIATGSRKVGETLKLRNDIKSAMLMKAGELIKELVQREGDQEVERVRSVCRGFDWLE